MNSPLRVLILTPTALPRLTGNAVTSERWRRALMQEGVVVSVTETNNLRPQEMIGVLERFRPDVVHAHHISRSGALMLDPFVADQYGHLPLVISPGGTDINLHVATASGMKIFSEISSKARFIVAQSPEIARLLHDLMPNRKERVAAVPKSFFWLGEDGFDLRAVTGCRREDILFFMPAGIRPVKGNLECLRAVKDAHAADPRIRVVFAGPALDAGYTGRFEQEIRSLEPFAKWIMRIPPKAMHAAYLGADCVLNHSSSEGLSNSLLEAMAAGRPVLASDIPGNRWLIEDKNGIGPCGCLFDPGDQADFFRKALQLAREPAVRELLSSNARLRAAAWPTPADEARGLLEVYEAAIAWKPR